MKFDVIKLLGDYMINLLFVLMPGSCGYFCLKYIIKEKIDRDFYMSMYRIKEELIKYGYYCVGLKIKNIYEVRKECLSLIKSGKKSYHYIIIKKVTDKFVFYYDPLFVNIRKQKIEKFVGKWSNICLFYTKV